MVKRTEQIMIRETPERRKQIEESADAAGLSVTEYLRQNARQGDVILTVGAGDIYRAGEALLK